MSSNLTQDIEQLKADIDRVRQFSNGDRNTVVNTEGGPVPSMAKIAYDNQIAAASVFYKTKALMDADTGQADGTVCRVVIDPTPANNGFYVYDTSSWVRIAYDTTDQLAAELDLVGPYAVGYAYSWEFPNLYTDPLHEDPSYWFPETSDREVVTYNDRTCVHILPSVTGYMRGFNVSEFGGNDKVSCSLRIEHKSAGTSGGRILLTQYSTTTANSSFETARETYNFDSSEWTDARTIVFENVQIDPSSQSIFVYYDTSNGQDIHISEILVAAGQSAGYRHPVIKQKSINTWPEPEYKNASTAQAGTVAIEDGYPVLTISSSSVASYLWDMAAVGMLEPGGNIHFQGEFQADGNDVAQVEIVFFDSTGTEISRRTVDNNTTLNTWVSFSITEAIPANTTKVQFRHNLQNPVGTVFAKFRKTKLLANGTEVDTDIGGWAASLIAQVKEDLAAQYDTMERYKWEEDRMYSSPNVHPDPYFKRDSNGGASSELYEGRWALRTLDTTSNYAGLIPRSIIEGNTLSVGITFASATYSSRVLFRQLNANGTQISSNFPERVTLRASDSSTGTVLTDKDREQRNVTIHPDCAFFQFYYEANGADLLVTAPWIREGDVSGYVPPAPKVPNFWPDPYWVGNKMSATEADQAGTPSDYQYRTFGKVLSMTPGSGLPVRRYYLDAVGALYTSWRAWIGVDLASDVADGAEMGVIYRDGAGVEISRQVTKNDGTNAAIFERKTMRLDIPDNTVTIEVRFICWVSTVNATVARFRNVTLTQHPVSSARQVFNMAEETLKTESGVSGGSGGTIWMSSAGSDTNSGSSSSPVKTGGKALSLLGGKGRIVVKEGDYSIADVFDLSPYTGADVEIVAEKLSKVRFLLGYEITGTFTLVPSYTKVWKASCDKAPNKFIFEHLTPESAIIDEDRHPLHRGRTYRLPSHRLRPATDLADIESSSTPKWYYDSNTNEIYLSAVDGGDPNLRTYYIPDGRTLYGGGAGRKVSLIGIQSWYGWVDFLGFDQYVCQDCYVLGSPGNGIRRDQSRGIEYRNEAAACDNDGTNIHNTLPADPQTPGGEYLPASTIVSFDSYCHHNWDDGDSCHERCEGQYVGGLWEYNGDRGIATSYGAHVTVIGGTTRRNGQNYIGISTRSAGEGFGVVGDVSNREGGYGTEMTCIGCTAIEDKVGFAASHSNCKVTAINCHTRSCEVAYNAELSSSYVLLRNCTDDGSTVIKSAPNGGTILVDNGTLVV